MKKAILGLISVILVLAACQPREEPLTREKALSTGFTMMDENRYDDAIEYFAKLLETDQHQHVKIALASAYAGRAGIKIQQIYSFVVVKNVPVPEVQLKGVSLDRQASETVKELATFAEQWIQIPTVQAEAREDLLAGLDVLNGSLEPGLRIYGAILRIVVLKSAILEGVEGFGKLAASGKKICAKDLLPYTEWASDVLRGVSYLAMDLEVSFPDQKKQYSDVRLKVESTMNQLKALKMPAGDKCL